MLRRLLFGLFIGVFVGGLLAAGVVGLLRTTTFSGPSGTFLAYAAAACAGALTGLLAGKPIWAADAKVEAGLKAFVGALLACGGMLALRRWGLGWVLDLQAFGAGGPAPMAMLPAVSLPLLGAALGALFELDNTDSQGEKRAASSRGTVGSERANPRQKRVSELRAPNEADDSAVSADSRELASRRAKR